MNDFCLVPWLFTWRESVSNSKFYFRNWSPWFSVSQKSTWNPLRWNTKNHRDYGVMLRFGQITKMWKKLLQKMEKAYWSLERTTQVIFLLMKGWIYFQAYATWIYTLKSFEAFFTMWFNIKNFALLFWWNGNRNQGSIIFFLVEMFRNRIWRYQNDFALTG